MAPRCFSRLCLAASAGALVAAASGCGDSLGVQATIPNVVDTTTIFALRGTDIATPSGFDIVTGLIVRTELGQDFDFAFDIDDADVALIFPAAALGVRSTAGVQGSPDAFDEITRAPFDGYVTDSALTVTAESVFIGRSRNSGTFCGFLGALPRYGKFRVLAIDLTARTVTLEHLVDANCGFRGLEPGLPSN